MEKEDIIENADSAITENIETDKIISCNTDNDNDKVNEEAIEHEKIKDETNEELVEEQDAEKSEGKEKELEEREEIEPKAPAEELGGEEHVTEEQLNEELAEGEGTSKEEKKENLKEEEYVEEEEVYIEEPPPDPAAPYEFSDSKEALKAPFELRPDQLAEVEQLWEVYQDYTPAYTDIKGYITEKELLYMLKSLLLMTYTAEQLQELIAFCVRPPHPNGHISYEQFLKMITIRQREFPIEEELRSALQVLDPEKTGVIDREFMKELLSKQGHKMSQKQLDSLIKEVDIANDGTIGIEDVVGTMCIDLNRDDIIMLQNALNPEEPPTEDEV